MRGEAAPVARPPITAPNKNFLSRFGSTFYPTINFEKGAENFANDFNPFCTSFPYRTHDHAAYPDKRLAGGGFAPPSHRRRETPQTMGGIRRYFRRSFNRFRII